MELSRNSLFAALIATVALCWVNTARADHYSGGNITYRCLGGNFFEVTLDVYLDCSGAPLTSQNLQLSNDCGVAFTVNGLPLTLTEEVSQLCGASVPNSTCNGGTLPGIMHYQFVTTLFLSPCNDWTIAWDICCRTGLQNTSGTPGMYLEATVNNAGGLCDSSPVLADNSIPFVCVNQPVSYNTGFSDPDGNSMSFELIAARFASPAPTNINYSGGFTGIAPIPGITIDPNTGQLAFTPTATGSYVVVVEVTTYDTNGVPIGTVMRDFLFVVSNCAGTPPTTTGLTNGTAGFITGTGSVEVCDGVPFCVDIPFSDADPGAITLTSNVAALLPGATFVVTGTNPAVGRLCWTPDPAFSPANILITARDNACPIPNEASTSVLITVVDPPAVPPDAGSNGSVNSCTAGPSISLFPLLGGTPDAAGVWTDPNGVVNNGIFVPSNDPFGSYTYTVGNGCQTDVAIVAVNANGGADPGTNGTLNICGNAASVPLINSLGGSPQAGGAWTGPSVVTGGDYAPATMAPGVYTYTVPGVAPCPSASATVTVSESSPPNAGTNGTLAICSNGAGVALVSRLGGTPAAGGTWSGPSVTTGNYDPATMAPGVYTYTVAGSGSCADATATVTVTENALPSAGSNGTLALCSSGASVALNASLGGSPQAGGTWSGPSAVVGGNYDPATMVAGVYTYTVNGTAPCTNATATVTVTENAAPNAGSNGTLAVCSNGASVALNASLGGSPQGGGTWSGPSAVVGGNYDPATMVAGVYTYTVSGTAPCANATATVSVTENVAPNAGSNGTLAVCSTGASVALNASLGGSPQAGGTWSGPSPVVGGNYDPATMVAGIYTYTVTGTAPCANSTATVTVTENTAPNAGTNGGLSICSDGAPVQLSGALGGSPQVGGTWSGPSGVVGGNYDPATMDDGVYTYTILGVAPCANSTASVTVTESTVPNAGTNGILSVCSDGVSVALAASLGGSPQPGGTWSGPSAVVGGIYDPGSMAPGIYTYLILGAVPCVDASASVMVVESMAPEAGSDGSLTSCSDGVPQVLFTSLGGTPQMGGTWAGPSVVVGGNYDPLSMDPGIYTYTVAGSAPCSNSSAAVTVVENVAPNAGSNGSLTVCDAGGPVALLNSLGGTPQPGGTWSGPSAVVGGNYDPATMVAGVYTYTVNGTAPCAIAIATVAVNETGSPDAGTDGTINLCSNGASTDLFAQLGGSPDAGGTWSGPSALNGSNYDPATMAPGVYTYTLTATAPCVGDASTVTVTENVAPNAGSSGSLTVCDAGGPVALLNSLGGTPQAGGTWSGPSAVIGGNYDPATMVAGVYTYTVNGTAPCANATATVAVNETGSPDAGTDGTINLCSNGAPTDLFAQLGGSPDAGGTWSGPSALNGSNYDPATMTPGTYTYALLASAPCASASATVEVQEELALDAGTSSDISLCAGAPAQSLFSILQGTPDAGGTWTGPGGASNGQFDPGSDPPGNYTYTHAGSACPGSSASVTIAIQTGPDAGGDGTVSLCSNSGVVQLFDQLMGSPDAGGVWTLPNGTPTTPSFDPLQSDGGTFIYTVPGGADCPADQATVSIVVNISPQAGTSGSLALCASSAAVSLFEGLTGTLDAGGTWAGPDGTTHASIIDPANDGPGPYTYTVSGVAPCITASSTVNVLIAAVPDAGDDAVALQCSSNAPFNLTTALAGTPQTNGTWYSPDGDVVPALFAPASNDPGTYTYIVPGVAPCGNDQSTLVVTVNQASDAGADATVQICENASTQVDLLDQLNGSPDSAGSWTAPDGTAFDGTFAPGADQPGTYRYEVTAPAPCPTASALVMVDVIPTPEASIVVSGADGCVPAEVVLSSTYAGSGSCQWTLWNGEVIDDCAPITRTVTEAGIYGATLQIEAGNGCGQVVIDSPDLFSMFATPVAAFYHLPEVINTVDPNVAFNNASTDAVRFEWDIAGLATSSAFHTSYSFPPGLAAEYTVCLAAIASPTCADTVCRTITIEDGLNVFVPNTFTPDGDGTNDDFKPVMIGADPDTYRFFIFDRLGQPLFETDDPSVAWNGSFSDGSEVPIGVYVWKVTVKDRVTTSRMERVGHVTLLR